MTPVERVLERLEKVRRCGKGWMARCPAHDDRSPSLSITEGSDGLALVHCFAGCSEREITWAIGLEVSDLFPDRDESTSARPPEIRSDRTDPVSVKLPMSMAQVLVESGEFAETMAAAETFALLEPRLARQEALSNWDYLTQRFDLPIVLRLGGLIRGVATLRHVRPGDLDNPHEVARLEQKGVTNAREIHRTNVIRRAVERLLEELRH